MTDTLLRFGPFTLDRAARQLRRDDMLVELNARYFDALCLLAAAPGELITKDRFMDEVWRGIPVTDEALTQCIRTLRRALGDDAAAPRFIATVPKHGYRFIAGASVAARPAAAPSAPLLPTIIAGTLGGLLAGIIGGAVYGLAANSQAAAVGGASLFLVLMTLTAAIAALGAAGVSSGIALAERRIAGSGPALVLGGASGGLAVGAVTKLIGGDALTLLFGSAPAHMTGAGEGALLGGAVGLALWWSRAAPSRGARLGGAALIGAAAGALASAFGGRFFAGSLASLGDRFAAARLDLGPISALLGEDGFGRISMTTTAMLEGALFAAAIVWAMRRVKGGGEAQV